MIDPQMQLTDEETRRRIANLISEIELNDINHVLFREEPIAEITETFNRFLMGDSPKNILIHGLPGTCKTTILRLIKNGDPNWIYISGEKCNTAHGILKGITDLTFNTRERLLSEAILKFTREPKGLIIDELNKIKRVEELKFLFNDLNTLYRSLNKKIPIVFATNKTASETRRFIPQDALDTFQLNNVELPSYNPLEMSGILEDRIKIIKENYGLEINIPEGFVNLLCAVICKYSDGRLRTAFHVFSESIRSNDFTRENIDKILKKMQGEEFEQGFNNLPSQEKKFLSTLILISETINDGENRPINISYLVEKIEEQTPQRISQIMNNLEDQGYIKRDNSTIIGQRRNKSIKFVREDIFQEVKELTKDTPPFIINFRSKE